jgi:hypothetical protein
MFANIGFAVVWNSTPTVVGVVARLAQATGVELGVGEVRRWADGLRARGWDLPEKR